jgi:DUF3068 family protein
MRKIVGLVLLGLGVFLIALATALPTFVYPRVAKAPADPDQYVVATGEGLTVLLAQSLTDGGVRVLTNQSVTVTRRVRGEVRPDAKRAEGDNVFYRLAFRTEVANQKNGLLNAYVEGGSFDGRTGLSNNCCGDYVSQDPTDVVGEPIRHEGIQFKFPFDTRKKSYPFWDVNVKQAMTAKFDGTEQVKGLTTYRFVQPIKDIVISRTKVPGSLLGLPAQPSVTADRVYSTTRTLWVEPYTGAIIKGSEKVDQRLVAQGKQAPVIQGTITYDDATVQRNIDTYADSAQNLRLVTKLGPLVCWIFGLLLTFAAIAALVLEARQGAATRTDENYDLEPVR